VSDAFKKAWARKVKEGYKYGEDALEQVRFGFELAKEERAREASMESARERLSKSLLGIYHLMWTGSVPNIVKAVEDLIDAKLRERGL
jgi:hypothetical protein